MSDEIKKEGVIDLNPSGYAGFDEMLPRSIIAEVDKERLSKSGSPTGNATLDAFSAGNIGGGQTIYRNPARRFYDPEITVTAIYLPKDIKRRNRWNRWYYDHDEIVGAVLDVHAELPYSKFQIKVDDPVIQREIEDCLDRTNFFSMLPLIDLEYMKIGEVFIHTHWSDTLGMWDNIVLHNPDYIEVKYSPFADQESVIELSPDEELKALIHSTRPEDQQLKKRLPQDIVKRVLTGRNIVLNSEDVTHVARRSNPYDIRGKSIIERLYRCFTPKTLVRMSDGSCKEIKDINIGDKVFSLHGEVQEVLDKVNYDIDDNIVELKLHRNNNSLQSTFGHKYLVRVNLCSCGCGERLTLKQVKKGYLYKKGHFLNVLNLVASKEKISVKKESLFEIRELNAEDIVPGDQLLIPINNEEQVSDLNSNTARLLGYYLSEGCHYNEDIIDKEQGICFSFNKDERLTLIKDLCEILEKEFKIVPYICKDKENGLRVSIRNKENYLKLSSFIRKYIIGDRSYNKYLNDDFLFYNEEIQMNLLFGEFRGDGSFEKKLNGAYCCTTSKKLAQQLNWILFRNGIYNKIRIKPAVDEIKILGKVCSARESYHISITGNFAKKFILDCWGLSNNYIFNDSFKEIYNIVYDLSNKKHSLSKIAAFLNENGYVGIGGGKFHNTTVKVILRNGGYGVTKYNFNMDYINKDKNYLYITVIDKNIIPYKGKVYDITVSNNHWWLADGSFVTSNTLMYEDKLRESQITVADNFIYPLKLFKLGDKQRGWIPNANHQKALAQMLQQAAFDPNFSLIYHYGLEVEYITVADKVMNLDKEWNEINEKKFMALGVSKQFLQSGENYAAANVGLQTQLARYRAKRDLFEVRWMRDKFFKVMAERNGWYKRDAREITSNVRIQRNKEELSKRLIIPDIIWDKKLAMRDDQQYLTFLNNVYAQGKGPVSVLTLLMAMGLTLNDELSNKEKQKELEQKFGITITPPAPAAAGGTGGPAGAPPLAPPTASSKIKEFFKFGKNKEVPQKPKEEAKVSYDENKTTETTNDFTGAKSKVKYGTYSEEDEIKRAVDISKDLYHIDENMWKIALKSSNISFEVVNILNSYDDKIIAIEKKANGNFVANLKTSFEEIKPILSDVYMQGKFVSYDITNFLPIYKEQYNKSKDIKDFSDLTLINEFGSWIERLSTENIENKDAINNLRSIANTCFSFGQLKGFQEQGIEKVKVSNTLYNDGLRYNIEDLLSKGRNLTAILSSEGDIITYFPCIENEDENVVLDPHISKYKDFISNGIKFKDCPIEFTQQIVKYTNKLGKFLKKKYDNIIFVKDIVDLPEWEEHFKQKTKKELEDTSITKEAKASLDILVTSTLFSEKLKKRGNMPIFINNRDLYISNWIGTEDKSLISNLLHHIKIDDEVLDKNIRKAFDENSYNLSNNEIDTYKIFGYIESISDENKIVGWRIIESNLDKTASSYNKLRYGKIWSKEGVCLNNEKDPVQIFNDNLKLWIEYPHKLNENIRQFFEKI